MKLNYSGQEKVQAPPAVVWAFVQDPERVARCLPDVQEVTVHDQAHMDAIVQVGVGMVRGKFKFNTNHHPIQDFYVREVIKNEEGVLTNKIIATSFTDHQDAYAKDCKM